MARLVQQRKGAAWDGHHGTTNTRYSQPGGLGRHVAQHIQLSVEAPNSLEALGPGQYPSASLGGCPREVRTLLTCHLLLDLDIANALPCIASQLDRLGLAPSRLLEALHAYSQDRDACLARLIESHRITPLGQKSPRDIAKALANSILFGSTYAAWAKNHAAAIGNAGHREAVFVRLEDQTRSLWAAVESKAQGVVAAAREEAPKKKRKGALGPAHVFTKVLNEIESCILHTATHFLNLAGWTVHSMQQDGLLVRPPPRLRPEQEGTRPGREPVTAAEAALSAIARQVSMSVAQPAPWGLGIDVTLVVKELYGLDPEPIMRSFD